MNQIERLQYTSKATGPMGTLALFNLLNAARVRNMELGITGLLIYVDGCFTQCIEGAAVSIDLLWTSLQNDPRHTDIELSDRSKIETRRYPNWTMAFSSYRYLNSLNMPGFFPIDQPGFNDLQLLTGKVVKHRSAGS